MNLAEFLAVLGHKNRQPDRWFRIGELIRLGDNVTPLEHVARLVGDPKRLSERHLHNCVFGKPDFYHFGIMLGLPEPLTHSIFRATDNNEFPDARAPYPGDIDREVRLGLLRACRLDYCVKCCKKVEDPVASKVCGPGCLVCWHTEAVKNEKDVLVNKRCEVHCGEKERYCPEHKPLYCKEPNVLRQQQKQRT